MRNIFSTFRQMVNAIGKPKRSPLWPAVRATHLRKFPQCEACGGRVDLDVHHIVPYHKDRALELNASNLMTLCASHGSQHHLRIGHNDGRRQGWDVINPRARESAAENLARLRG